MGKSGFRMSAIAVLLTLAVFDGSKAQADVSIGINIGPPPIVVPQPPEVVLVPQTDVYFVPGVEFDVFFYGGYWWSPRGDRWYRARSYDGPWGVVAPRFVPRPVYRVPHDYRMIYEHEHHIPYKEWKHRRKHYEKERKKWKKHRREHEDDD